MIRHAGKVDLAAQAKRDICDRCFAEVTDADAICPECGAPLKQDGSVQAADTAMHSELAQANVLRLRGEIDAAEKQCLSILKRYPNEPEAHSLLGELSLDKKDTGRAIEWFELALDLNPNSAPDQARLDELKRQVQTAETARTEDQLGLPKKQSYTPYIMGFVALVIIIVTIAALKSPKSAPTHVDGGVVMAPRSTGGGTLDPTAGAGGTPVHEGEAVSTGEEPTENSTLSMDDRALMQVLQKDAAGETITAVEQDPRNKALTITYTVARAEDARRAGAMIAKDALDRSPETLVVTVRGVSADRLAFVADATRTKLVDIEGANSQDFQSGNDTWISTLLQREWPPTSPTTPATATTPTTPQTTPPATPEDTATSH